MTYSNQDIEFCTTEEIKAFQNEKLKKRIALFI